MHGGFFWLFQKAEFCPWIHSVCSIKLIEILIYWLDHFSFMYQNDKEVKCMTQNATKCQVGDKKATAAFDILSFWRSKLVCDKKRHALIHCPLFPFLPFPGNYCFYLYRVFTLPPRSLPALFAHHSNQKRARKRFYRSINTISLSQIHTTPFASPFVLAILLALVFKRLKRVTPRIKRGAPLHLIARCQYAPTKNTLPNIPLIIRITSIFFFLYKKAKFVWSHFTPYSRHRSKAWRSRYHKRKGRRFKLRSDLCQV